MVDSAKLVLSRIVTVTELAESFTLLVNIVEMQICDRVGVLELPKTLAGLQDIFDKLGQDPEPLFKELCTGVFDDFTNNFFDWAMDIFVCAVKPVLLGKHDVDEGPCFSDLATGVQKLEVHCAVHVSWAALTAWVVESLVRLPVQEFKLHEIALRLLRLLDFIGPAPLLEIRSQARGKLLLVWDANETLYTLAHTSPWFFRLFSKYLKFIRKARDVLKAAESIVDAYNVGTDNMTLATAVGPKAEVEHLRACIPSLQQKLQGELKDDLQTFMDSGMLSESRVADVVKQAMGNDGDSKFTDLKDMFSKEFCGMGVPLDAPDEEVNAKFDSAAALIKEKLDEACKVADDIADPMLKSELVFLDMFSKLRPSAMVALSFTRSNLTQRPSGRSTTFVLA